MILRTRLLWLYAGYDLQRDRPWTVDVLFLPRPSEAKLGYEIPAAARLSFGWYFEPEPYRINHPYAAVAWTGREPGVWRLRWSFYR